jgi:hypothetical protein
MARHIQLLDERAEGHVPMFVRAQEELLRIRELPGESSLALHGNSQGQKVYAVPNR